jgi:hypothetical protein
LREFGNVGLVKEVTRAMWVGAGSNACCKTCASVCGCCARIRAFS